MLATAENVEGLEAEKAAVPSIASIKAELAEAKALFEKRRDDIREHKVIELFLEAVCPAKFIVG